MSEYSSPAGDLPSTPYHALLAKALIAKLGPMPPHVQEEALAKDCGQEDCPIHGVGGTLNIMGRDTIASKAQAHRSRISNL